MDKSQGSVLLDALFELVHCSTASLRAVWVPRPLADNLSYPARVCECVQVCTAVQDEWSPAEFIVLMARVCMMSKGELGAARNAASGVLVCCEHICARACWPPGDAAFGVLATKTLPNGDKVRASKCCAVVANGYSERIQAIAAARLRERLMATSNASASNRLMLQAIAAAARVSAPGRLRVGSAVAMGVSDSSTD